MGNRAECPACKAYTSGVYSDLNFTHSDCQYCGCPHDLLLKWNEEMKPLSEEFDRKKIHSDLSKKIDELFCENCMLTAKIKKMQDLIAWRDDIFEPFLKIKEILEE